MKSKRMHSGFNNGVFLHPLNARCTVCETELTPLELRGKPQENYICKSFDCQKIWQSKKSTPAYLFTKKIEFHRQLLQQKQQAEAALKLRIEGKLKQENQENLRIEKTALKQHARYSLNATSFPTLSLPTGPSKVTNISQKRVTRYTQHLYQIISQAFSLSSFSASVPDTFTRHDKMTDRIHRSPEVAKLNDQFCFTCKGGCCVKGNDQAYLSVDTIRRIKQQKPRIRPQALLNIYLSSLATKVIKGSCINHTNKGCGLQREYRSDICNRFYCDELHDYSAQYDMHSDSISGALVINRKQNLWQRNAAGDNRVETVSIVDPNKVEIITVE
jgi:hypothetical protein